MTEQQTFFGKILTSISDQQERVHDVFKRVHGHYDLMNDVMSFGTHRLWKRSFMARLPFQPHQNVLDLACGTGDIAIGLWRRFKTLGIQVTLCDPNYAMLEQAWKRAADCGWLDADFVCARAEELPYAGETFHGATCAFGVRNMGNRSAGLRNILRTLQKGGWFHMLEFHPPTGALTKAYVDHCVPLLGSFIAADRDAYAYLAESIETFVPPEEMACELTEAGFSDVGYRSLGPVSIHWGTRA